MATPGRSLNSLTNEAVWKEVEKKEEFEEKLKMKMEEVAEKERRK